MAFIHQLQAYDTATRIQYCLGFLGFVCNRVYTLHTLFFVDEACFHLRDTVIVRRLEYGVLNTHMQCVKIVCIRQRLMHDALVWNMNYRSIILWRNNCCRKWSTFLINLLLCWKRMNRISGSSKIGRLCLSWKHQQLSSTTWGIALSGVDFGHHDFRPPDFSVGIS